MESQEEEGIKVWVVSVKLRWENGAYPGNGDIVLPCCIGYSIIFDYYLKTAMTRVDGPVRQLFCLHRSN